MTNLSLGDCCLASLSASVLLDGPDDHRFNPPALQAALRPSYPLAPEIKKANAAVSLAILKPRSTVPARDSIGACSLSRGDGPRIPLNMLGESWPEAMTELGRPFGITETDRSSTGMLPWPPPRRAASEHVTLAMRQSLAGPGNHRPPSWVCVRPARRSQFRSGNAMPCVRELPVTQWPMITVNVAVQPAKPASQRAPQHDPWKARQHGLQIISGPGGFLPFGWLTGPRLAHQWQASTPTHRRWLILTEPQSGSCMELPSDHANPTS
ncbi:MAG: hypothetical protein M1823_003540 [Watsoniomyces obsoletus]|nr:MAG: hypothetical protein M1823_003540 [Watsoniomyces obsoletus]